MEVKIDKTVTSFEVTQEARMRPVTINSPIHDGERIAIGATLEREPTIDVKGKKWREATDSEYLYFAQRGQMNGYVMPIREKVTEKTDKK